VRFDDFRALVDRLAREVPAEYLDGIVAIDVSPKTVPHPVYGDVYTLGACAPLHVTVQDAESQSRLILYHGSFAALAQLGAFDWREQAWETLTHELRHHLERRAHTDLLAEYDWAAEQNFARHSGQRFDPAFFRSGERLHEGVWKVDHDVFIERDAGRETQDEVHLVWHGRRYRVSLPQKRSGPLFLTLDGLVDPTPGDVVLVVRPARRLRDILRRRAAPVQQLVRVTDVDG
jgi:hypothetical protein